LKESEKKGIKRKETPNPEWWGPYSILLIILTLLGALIPLIFYLVLGYPLLEYLIYCIPFVIVMGFFYYSRWQISKKINMVIYILAGAVFLFLMVISILALLIIIIEIPPLGDLLGDEMSFILFFIIIPIIGGSLGFILGRNVNFRIPFGVVCYE
jgi:hypothetical protein